MKAPRLIIGAVYQELKEEMKFLWTKDLRINTVHVIDVARALALLAEFALDPNRKAVVLGQVFNLADKGDTDQEKVNVILRKIYGIQTGYQGTIISNLAKVYLHSRTYFNSDACVVESRRCHGGNQRETLETVV